MSGAPPADDGGPFEEQRRIYDLLSQETRHLILQFVLGHPTHLPSLDELSHLIPKNKSVIRDQLAVLADADVVERYDHPPNEDTRNLPSQFYGLTERGVEVLAEYNYLRGLPVARAVYDSTRLTEKVQRHRDAPRPTLPEAVSRALTIDDGGESADHDRVARDVRDRKAHTHSVDDQVDLVTAFYEAGIDPNHEGIKRTEVLNELAVDVDYQQRSLLDHLVDLGLLEETAPSGPDVFAISERIDEIVNGRVSEEAEANLDALVEHIDDELQPVELDEEAAELGARQEHVSAPSVALADGAGRTIRSILAEEFEVDPERVTEYLQSGDPVDRLNAAVEAVESAEEVSRSEEYGRVLFVRPAYRYRLTTRAMELV